MSEEQLLPAKISKRIRALSRLEQVFYSVVVATAVILAVGVVYMQSRNQQVKQEITRLNSEIEEANNDLNLAKQEINELTKFERISEIAAKNGLTIKKENIQPVE